MVTITPKPDVFVDLAGLARAIRGAGFSPGDMTLSAVGDLVERDGATVFWIRAWPEAYPIKPPAESPAGEHLLNADVDYARKPLRLEVK